MTEGRPELVSLGAPHIPGNGNGIGEHPHQLRNDLKREPVDDYSIPLRLTAEDISEARCLAQMHRPRWESLPFGQGPERPHTCDGRAQRPRRTRESGRETSCQAVLDEGTNGSP